MSHCMLPHGARQQCRSACPDHVRMRANAALSPTTPPGRANYVLELLEGIAGTQGPMEIGLPCMHCEKWTLRFIECSVRCMHACQAHYSRCVGCLLGH